MPRRTDEHSVRPEHLNAPGDAPPRAPAADELLAQVYDQLRRTAGELMQAEREGHTLSATALVHEAYLKLIGPRQIPWRNRAHFYAAVVQAMPRVLIDYAKARARHKRGGRRARVDLDDVATLAAADADPADLIAIEEAIGRLGQQDRRAAEIVRLRYYAGLSVAETAAMLGVSVRTVEDDWRFARAWLSRELRSDERD
ncbi:MAG: sigma-70 family RNA polymerase sigma factor [Phycisphaerae bacterium]|nr:ECF-type sigma factor [Phycisphaerae bacterium]NUQ46097.1 sigma-70 family RNA polymerase sigma factor [Phycisphaerae bacterium]